MLAPTFLLSIFLPWIQMWSLEAHGLLVTRKWWHLRARAKEQSPSNWAVDCIPAATHLLSLIKREKSTPVYLSHCKSGFLLLAIKSILNGYNHPHQPSLSNPTWEAMYTVVTNLGCGINPSFESWIYHWLAIWPWPRYAIARSFIYLSIIWES